MLSVLRIKDLAVIEAVEVEFEPGFCALTGETGAGKSILVDALTLALGAKAPSDLIRTGADQAEVEALFDLSELPALRKNLLEAGFLAEPDEDELVVRRFISRQGRGRAWVNGRIESAARLFELGRLIVDIYGQHEYQTLLKPEKHRELLDAFGAIQEKLEAYRKAHRRLSELNDERKALDLDETQKREREDLLRWRVREIEAAKLAPGEDGELEAERGRLKHAGLLIEAGRSGAEQLSESDHSVAGGLRDLAGKLAEAESHDAWFAGPREQVEQAASILEDAARELSAHVEGLEADPQRLAWVEDRLDEVKKLKKKYGGEIASVLSALAEAREELDRLSHNEERLRELSRLIEEAREKAASLARDLTRARKKAGAELARAVEKELAGLGMDKTRFEARIEPLPSGELGPHGADSVAFLLSPNPGEEMKPLTRIASGGELSRIMLALRVLLSADSDVPVMVFDEVDQGVGGAVAEAVGRRMERLGRAHQVLCVTHLSQIACLAEDHLKVVKRQTKDRTNTGVVRLVGEERVEELARMSAGADVTEAARAHAREMLASARKPGPSTPKSRSREKNARGAGR